MPVFQLTEDLIFPRPTLAEESGLLAIGGDLSPDRLIAGYRWGIFPWYSEGDPILWWFTSPRLVIYPDEFRISKRLARYVRKPLYMVTMDKAFEQVIDSCASVRTINGEETWITDDMKNAYCRLHDLGYAHSVECWHNETLAGGLYGIALDRVFFGESMFTRMSNSSKIALASLVIHLKKNYFGMIDCQMTTDHMLRYGAREISGRDFLRHLNSLISTISPNGVWKDDTNISSL